MKRFLSGIIIIFVFFSLSAQNKIDSLYIRLAAAHSQEKANILNDISYEFRKTDCEKSLNFARQALDLSEKIKYKKGIASAYFKIGLYYFNTQSYDQAIQFYQRSNELYRQLGDKENIAHSYDRIGLSYMHLSDFEKGTENIAKAIELLETLDEEKTLSFCYNNISQALSRLSRYDEALDYLHKALALKQKMQKEGAPDTDLSIATTFSNIGVILLRTRDFTRALEYFFLADDIRRKYRTNKENYILEDGNLLNNIGITYQQMKDYDKGLEYQLQALEIYRKEKKTDQIATALNNIGYVYDMKKDWWTCLQYYLESLKLKIEVGDNYGIANCAKNVGSIYLEVDDLPKALEYMDMSMNKAVELGLTDIIKDNIHLYSRIYEKMNMYEKALEYERKFSVMQDSIFTSSMWGKLADMEAKYHLSEEKKEKEILKKDKKILLLDKEKAIQAKTRSYLIAILLFLIIVYLFDLYFRKRKKNKNLQEVQIQLEKRVQDRTSELQKSNLDLQKEIEERQIAEEIIRNSLHEKVIMLREIHHRVKNNLQIISSIISLQMRNVADDTQAVDLLMNTQNRIYSMSLIHEKLYIENNLANIDFEDYIRGLVDYLISSYQDQGRRIYSRIDAANIFLNVTTAIPCGLLINEIISNSLKHAFQDQQKGEVFVYMHQDEGGTLHLKAGNNGAEFDFKESNNGTSIGLRLIELLSRQLHGKLEVASHEGVCYTLTFEEIGKGDMA